MNEFVLEVEAVGKSFGGLQAVADVSFRVRRGDIYGVIGPNGAGKSTLFNLIAGVIRPTTGRISFMGRDVTNLPAYKKCRLGMGRTFQAAQSFAHHTVEENLLAAAFAPASSVGAWLRMRSRPEEGARIKHLLELIGLGDRRSNYPADLNNLELQKLSIGMALVNRPSLLLLDEPSGGLIEAEVSQLKEFLRQLNQEGVTLVVIDHKMSLIMSTCNDIAVLAAGKLVASGVPKDLVKNPVVREVYLGHH